MRKSAIVVLCGVGMVLTSALATHGAWASSSPNYNIPTDVLDSSGGGIGSGSYSVFFSCSGPAAVGYSASDMFHLYAGFVPKFYSVLSGLPVGDDGAMPHAVMLSPGNPNPFVSSTRISYAVPSAGWVSLSVYDVSGRRIRTIRDGMAEPGFYAASWDGRNDEGREMGPGVYMSLLDAAGERRTRKLVLVK